MQTTTSKQNGGRQGQPVPPVWPSYTGVSQYVGTTGTGRVTVYVDPSLGSEALANARALLADADRVVAANDRIFGTQGGPVNVIVFALDGETDGSGGADHGGCDYTTGAAIEVCASYGQPERVSALFEAELSECSMNGNLCGESTGEALSRLCAAVVGNDALSDFTTAPEWGRNGFPNFVDRTDQTDRNPISTGCGMAFLSWLRGKGYALEVIAPAMVSLGDAGTLAELYAKLTGDDAANAWDQFIAAVRALPGGVVDDDPFRATAPLPRIGFTPWTAEVAGRVFGSIFAGLAAGKDDAAILAGVRAVLRTSPASSRYTEGRSCVVRSHRLRASRSAAAAPR